MGRTFTCRDSLRFQRTPQQALTTLRTLDLRSNEQHCKQSRDRSASPDMSEKRMENSTARCVVAGCAGLASRRESATISGVRRRRASLRAFKRGLVARLAAGLLLFSAVPGADALLLDLVHLVAHGHVADESGHEHLEADGDCCSGLFHLCACHHQIANLSGGAMRIALAGAERRLGVGAAAVLRLSGYRAAPYRPPSA
jgi:hypothetical protein